MQHKINLQGMLEGSLEEADIDGRMRKNYSQKYVA